MFEDAAFNFRIVILYSYCTLTVRQPSAMFKVWLFYDMKILSSISFLTMKMELFQKSFWRTLQAICACS